MLLALRRLARSPAFTATALATLALCLGANLAIFTVVDAILVRPLPFPEPERLVSVVNSYPGSGYPRGGSSIPHYFDRRDSIKAFASVSLIAAHSVVIGEAGSPQRVPVARVTPEFFSTVGVPLARGRAFTDAELHHGADQVAILTDSFWRTRFGADPDVVGQTFLNDGLPVTVVGVLPPGFRYLSTQAEFFRPLAHGANPRDPHARHYSAGDMIARLAPGATLMEAQAQLDALNAAQLADDPMAASLPGWGYHTFTRPLQADHVLAIKPTLVLLQAGGVLLLLIGAVNLANLFLIRASTRARELMVRRALGANRRHITREVLTETMLVASSGGALGLLVGSSGVQLFARLGIDRLPLGATVSFDLRHAGLALLVALALAVLLALPIIWFNLHAKIAPGLQARSGTASRAAQRVRHAFIVTQVALAFVLLSGTGLLGLSLKRVLETPPGFNATSVLTGQITLPWKTYPEKASQRAFVDRLLSTLRALPGVTHVAINNSMPFTGRVAGGPVAVEGPTSGVGENPRAHHRSGVTGDYFAVMDIPLIRGRLLEDADNHRTLTVCVIDRALADRYWPGADPVGRRLAFRPTFTEEKAVTVVGVVGDVKQNELGEADGFGMAYFPYAKFQTNFFYLAVRTALPTESIALAIQKAVLQLDGEIPVDDLRPLVSRVSDSLVARRSPALLVGLFAGVALLLAAIGTYGVLAYAVSQRRREIGVRLALGALPRQILTQFLRLGVRLLLISLPLGALGAWAAGRSMQSQLFGVRALDAGIGLATAGVMLVVVLLATLLPSCRAARVNPLDALRDE